MNVAADRVMASLIVIAAGPLTAFDVGAQVARAPRFERVATIGCDECFAAGDPRGFSEITDVAISANGTVWVADGAAPKLRAFRIDGTPLRAFGAHGRGPGELLSVSRLLTEGTTLIAIDMFARKIVRFDSVGTLLDTHMLGHVPMDADSPAGSADVVTLTGEFRPGTSSVHRWSPGANRSLRILGPLADFPSVKAPGEATGIAVATDGRIALSAAGDEYRIRVYARDGSWREIARDIARTRYSDGEREALDRRRARSARLLVAEATRSGAGPGAPPPLPTEKPRLLWRGLRFDPTGRLWVLTGRGDEREAVLDLFDPRHNYIGEVRVPGTVERLAFTDGYVVSSGENEDGVPTVTVWRVVP